MSDVYNERYLDELMANEHEFRASLERVTKCLATFIREHPDPGSEALAALYEAQQLLQR